MLINVYKSSISPLILSRDESINAQKLFPFHSYNFNDKLKYLGFHLRPNYYKKAYQHQIIAKIEGRLKVWNYRWLSRVGIFVLVKFVLEAIPVFWMSLSWIPKGALKFIRKICYRFLWVGSKERRIFSWVKRDKISLPKIWGGWGPKNIPSLCKALAEKV